MDVDVVAEKVSRIMREAPVGTVVTVMADGTIVTDGPSHVRPAWERRKRRLTAFVVGNRRPSPLSVWRRIDQGLRKLES